MPARNSIDSRTSGDPVQSVCRSPAGPLESGVYLTDGVFLYRVVHSGAAGDHDLVELEDCHRLDVVRVAASDVRQRQLRVVTPDRLSA